jgi:hypothetical protein
VGRTRRGLAVLLAAASAASPASAAIPWDAGGAVPPARTPPSVRPDPLCAQSYADDAPRGGPRLRFGIGPRLAGENGARQRTPATPERPRARDAALRRLAGHSRFVVRLNRLFESDGRRGIRRFEGLARHFGRLGLDVELQVRYHPRPARNGDIAAWLRYVRAVVRALGPVPAVTALQITNEVNLTASPNTSDGAYRRAATALVRGVETAKAEARRRGYRRLQIGFNAFWRLGASDAAFWRSLGRAGGARLRRATDWVGVDLYPGTYVPAPGQVVHPGDAFLEGLAQVRECSMPLAGFGRATPLRIEETGWPTGPGRSPATQARVLRAFVRTADAYRGTYHITDFRWFNLRDNTSTGPDFESFFGLLSDDYAPKPGFGVYRRLVARLGARR